jgi:DNA adenine methylase
MSVPHPIPYQGSKRGLAGQILAYIPPGFDRLVEPFAGSAAISLAALHHGSVKHVVIGDSNMALIALWQEIVTAPDSLADAYHDLWQRQLGQERTFYDQIRAEFNTSHRPDHFLFLLARCVKAAVRYNANGDFNQSPDNRRKGTRPATMRQHIIAASRLLSNRSEVHSCDYRALLETATPDDIVYLDPPYQGVCKNRDPRYKEKVAFDAFVATLDRLNARSIAYLVSYDGRTGSKTYGEPLPSRLGVQHVELLAGRSSQATLLGRNEMTVESLYLSPALAERLTNQTRIRPLQLSLFEAS